MTIKRITVTVENTDGTTTTLTTDTVPQGTELEVNVQTHNETRQHPIYRDRIQILDSIHSIALGFSCRGFTVQETKDQR